MHCKIKLDHIVYLNFCPLLYLVNIRNCLDKGEITNKEFTQ